MNWLSRLRHSIKLRLLAVFLLLALSVAFIFISGAQKAFSLGWREAARPLLMDYVSRLAADVAPTGTPEVQRAQAIVSRLPVLTIAITGPRVNWRSQPPVEGVRGRPERHRGGDRSDWGDDREWDALLKRTSADGHTITFGLNDTAFERRPRLFGVALTALLFITGLAWLYVRRLLRPLDDIRAGAMRFGSGEFAQPINLLPSRRHDELGELASTINTMGQDIHQMLEAQRALLLAISHELRSPLTRARLNTELLPDTAEVSPQREALLRDLAEMAQLINDLLESERLAGHQALHREPTDLTALAREVIDELSATQAWAVQVRLRADADLPTFLLDRIRIRLLLRNLLDNALRHGAGAALPPELHICRSNAAGQGVEIEVRDHGPGVPEEQLAQLSQAFFRPDTARTRSAGGVGLGLYLCRLVAQAHGGTFAVRNARPGLAVTVSLPPA